MFDAKLFRSLIDSLEKDNENEADDIGSNEKEEVSRRRRDSSGDEEESSTVEKVNIS